MNGTEYRMEHGMQEPSQMPKVFSREYYVYNYLR